MNTIISVCRYSCLSRSCVGAVLGGIGIWIMIVVSGLGLLGGTLGGFVGGIRE